MGRSVQRALGVPSLTPKIRARRNSLCSVRRRAATWYSLRSVPGPRSSCLLLVCSEPHQPTSGNAGIRSGLHVPSTALYPEHALRFRSLMKDFQTVMVQFGFEKAGSIVVDGQHRLAFALDDQSSEHGFVYLWVEATRQDRRVVYVGKAGKTLRARCRQHEGGFRGRGGPGAAHARRLFAGLSEQKHYEIWARKSGVVSLFDVSALSMACVEELAFIEMFHPQWNSA